MTSSHAIIRTRRLQPCPVEETMTEHLDGPDDRQCRPDGLSDKTVEALGGPSKALETTERARGRLYDFHQLTGTADFQLDRTVELLHQRATPKGRNGPYADPGPQRRSRTLNVPDRRGLQRLTARPDAAARTVRQRPPSIRRPHHHPGPGGGCHGLPDPSC